MAAPKYVEQEQAEETENGSFSDKTQISQILAEGGMIQPLSATIENIRYLR